MDGWRAKSGSHIAHDHWEMMERVRGNRVVRTAGNVGVRNVGAEEHALALLQHHVVEEVDAPAAHIAREVGGDPQEQVAQQRLPFVVACVGPTGNTPEGAVSGSPPERLPKRAVCVVFAVGVEANHTGSGEHADRNIASAGNVSPGWATCYY